MSPGFRIGVVQTGPLLGEREANLTAMSTAVEGIEADLFVFPELAISGYAFEDRQALLSAAEDVRDGPGLRFSQSLAEKKDAALIFGLPLAEGDRVYNAAALMRPGTEPVFYRKLHLFDRECRVFDAGDRPPEVHAWRGTKIGMMICFDWLFPETARLLTLAGAEIIAHPSNLVLSFCQEAMRTRSLENGVFSVTVNRVGREIYADGDELNFTGKSQVIDPRGRRLLALGAGEASQMTVSIDPGLSEEKALTARNHLLRDRRPEHYGALIEEEDVGS